MNTKKNKNHSKSLGREINYGSNLNNDDRKVGEESLNTKGYFNACTSNPVLIICLNTGFLLPVFYSTRTNLKILSLYRKITVRENCILA